MIMEWPEELLKAFDDELLRDVRPKPKAPTPNDRMAKKLLEVNVWVKEHGQEPGMNGAFSEKRLAVALKALRENVNDGLLQYDEYNLLTNKLK